MNADVQGADRPADRPTGRPGGHSGAASPVSVIMPVLNAEQNLTGSVRDVLAQAYPGELEVVLAVGRSKDKTEKIANQLAAADTRITVVPNPSGQISSGLNAALRASRYQIIVRVDERSRLPAGYIATAVRTLHRTGAANVGGHIAPEGVTPFQHAAAWAMTSPRGIGAARIHRSDRAG